MKSEVIISLIAILILLLSQYKMLLTAMLTFSPLITQHTGLTHPLWFCRADMQLGPLKH
jgi:hypothetical protein